MFPVPVGAIRTPQWSQFPPGPKGREVNVGGAGGTEVLWVGDPGTLPSGIEPATTGAKAEGTGRLP